MIDLDDLLAMCDDDRYDAQLVFRQSLGAAIAELRAAREMIARQKEALAWAYQAIGARWPNKEALDNLSAVQQGKMALHEWPVVPPDESATDAAILDWLESKRHRNQVWECVSRRQPQMFSIATYNGYSERDGDIRSVVKAAMALPEETPHA